MSNRKTYVPSLTNDKKTKWVAHKKPEFGACFNQSELVLLLSDFQKHMLLDNWNPDDQAFEFVEFWCMGH